MRLHVSISIIAMLLAGCAAPTPPSVVKNLYEVESAARKMEPQSAVGLLYLISSGGSQGHFTKLQINDELALRAPIQDRFFVFCLPPGPYNIDFGADALVPNKAEFMNVKAGEIYVRDFSQYFAALIVVPLTSSKLEKVDLQAAKEQIAIKRIGDNAEYNSSKYRCKSLAAV